MIPVCIVRIADGSVSVAMAPVDQEMVELIAAHVVAYALACGSTEESIRASCQALENCTARVVRVPAPYILEGGSDA